MINEKRLAETGFLEGSLRLRALDANLIYGIGQGN